MDKCVCRAAVILFSAVLLSGCAKGADSVPEFVYSENAETAAAHSEPARQADISTEESCQRVEEAPHEQPVSVLTSGDPLHYIEMTFDGFSISVSGRYDGNVLHGIGFGGKEYSPVYEGDYFKAQISAADAGAGFLSIVFEFDRHKEEFRLYVSDSGCLPAEVSENAAGNSKAANRVIDLPAEGVAEYVCYEKNPEHIRSVLVQVKEISDAVCEGLDSDYDKLRALAAWVSTNIYYDFDTAHVSVTSQTVCVENVLSTHRTVCGGFSTLFSVLCQAQDIECCNVRGAAINTGLSYAEEYGTDAMHEWNYAVIDGRRVWVDTVWNTFNAYSDGSYNSGAVYYQYFDPTEEILALDHRASRCERRDYFALAEDGNADN